MHSYYLGPAVSETAVREEATARLAGGERVALHRHGHGESCAGRCEWWQPAVPAQRAPTADVAAAP